MTNMFPHQDEDAKNTTSALQEILRNKIDKSGGWLSFSDYMNCVLYHPLFGYYNNGIEKFGAKGDFITAPEISPIFAKAISQQILPILSQMSNPQILEFGAGNGVLAKDILDYMLENSSLDIEYKILETSVDLRNRQKVTLEKYKKKINWLDRLPRNPFNAVVLANEVLDAMPVHRFIKKGKKILPYGVSLVKEKFSWKEGNEDSNLSSNIDKLEGSLGYPFPENYVSEFSYNIPAWINSVSSNIDKGAILIIDYGLNEKDYYDKARKDGTLVCHYRHNKIYDPFSLIGLQDISSWVNFSSCADTAIKLGLNLSGYTTQGQFILETIIKNSLDDKSNSVDNLLYFQALKKMILPGEMGEYFKLMLLTKNINDSILAGRSFISRL
mgnify:FL=1